MQIEILNIFDAIQYMVYVYKVTAGRTMQIDEMTIKPHFPPFVQFLCTTLNMFLNMRN
jgi:hypothetical protein